jgi:hypothetical protein
MPGQLLIEVLALNFTRLFFYGHRGHPVHHVTSGLATVIFTVHQKSAVIFDNSLTWQDTDMIKASIYCNPILGVLARLVGSCLREITFGSQLMQVAVALVTSRKVHKEILGARRMGLEPELDHTSKLQCKRHTFDDDGVSYTSPLRRGL